MKPSVSILLSILLAFTVAGCVTTSGNLGDAASRLDRSADALYDETRNDRDSALERDARELADVARDFNRDVRDRRSREELRGRFESVASRYHDLRDEIRREPVDSREATAFRDVTRAYLDLERELQYKRLSAR